MAAARWAAALLALALVLGAAGQADPVVVASYGQARLWLKPYDWSYLRGERVSGCEFLFRLFCFSSPLRWLLQHIMIRV
jgi:hypothetical protein